MKEKWLIAVDLDGTLFNTNHQISPRTLNTMQMTVERGHSMVIVTWQGFTLCCTQTALSCRQVASQFISEAGGADTLEQGCGYESSERCDVLKLSLLHPIYDNSWEAT